MLMHRVAASIAFVAVVGFGQTRGADVSAEELGKQFAPDTPDALKAYQGKTLRVTGKVSMAHEPFIYLETGSKFPTGQPVLVTLDYGKEAMPEVARLATVVVEGKLDRKGVFGPVLTDCKIVGGGQEAKALATPFPPTRVLTKKGLAAKKAERNAPPIDPRAVALRFDGPIREGEPGYRAEATSFRLRFGPGRWLGTVVGKSVAWGVGNQNKDHWGVGSGEGTFSSDVREDADGAYFVFSMNGTDWESDRVAVLFRLTLPDGRPGVATALVSVDNGP